MAVTKDAGFPVTLRDTATSTDAPWPTFTTPGTNRMVVAMMLLNGPTTNAVSSFTSPNLTWANAVAVVDGGNNWRVEIWTAFAASVVTNEQIDSTYSGSPFYSRQSLLIWSFDGSDSSGVGDVDSSTTANDGDVSIVASAAGSYLLAGLPYRSAGGDIAPLTDSTSEYDAGLGGGFNFNERACSRPSTGAGALTVGFTTAEIFQSAAIAGVEIKAAAGGGSVEAAPVAGAVTVAAGTVDPVGHADPSPMSGVVAVAAAVVDSTATAAPSPIGAVVTVTASVVDAVASGSPAPVSANVAVTAGTINPVGHADTAPVVAVVTVTAGVIAASSAVNAAPQTATIVVTAGVIAPVGHANTAPVTATLAVTAGVVDAVGHTSAAPIAAFVAVAAVVIPPSGVPDTAPAAVTYIAALNIATFGAAGNTATFRHAGATMIGDADG